MKNAILKSGSALRGVVLGVLVACAVSATAHAAVVVTVNPADAYVGYMNVFEIPANGGGYVFGSGWGTPDLTATFSGSDLTLGPNHINDPNSFWYTPAGGPGCTGNKTMEANMYVEPAGLAGQSLTFEGNVVANSLTSAHVARAFIRDFAPDFSSSVDYFVVLPPSGGFTVSASLINDPARHVQYGFQVKGPDVWVTDLAPYGFVTVGPVSATAVQKTTWGSLKALYR